MHRSLSRSRLRSIAGSSCRSKSWQEGWNNGGERMESSQSQNSVYLEGLGHLGFRADSVTSFLQRQIVNALRLGKRDRASNMLLNLSQQNESLRSDDFVYILDYCARSPDPLFVMETWRIMEEKEIGTNRRCNLFIIQALTRGGYLEEAFNWLSALGENYLTTPILPMYNAFLNGCARMQSAIHANYCLDLMEDRLLGKSEVTYYELLKLAVWQQSLSTVHEIWKEFVKCYSPSIISLRKFIWSFTRLGDLVSACEALQHMVDLAFQGRATIARSAEGKFQTSRLDIPIPTKSDFSVGRCSMSRNFHAFPPSSFGNELGQLGVADVEGNLMETSSQRNQVPFLEKGLNSLSTITSNSHRSFTATTRLENSVFSLRRGNAETLPVMKVLRWSFSDVIHACAQSRNCELAEQLFLQMQDLGLEPSSHTYDGLIRAIVYEKGVFEGIQLVKAMERLSLKPYDATLATLSIGCSKALDLDLAESILDQIVGTPSLPAYNALLAACDVMDKPERAVRVLAKMKQLKLKSDIWTYELLFSLFGNVNAPYEKGNMLSQVVAAKRINTIEMDMWSNGIKHSNLSMTNLVKALGAEGMIREMLQYLHQAENQAIHTSISLGTEFYNAVLHSLVESKDVHLSLSLFFSPYFVLLTSFFLFPYFVSLTSVPISPSSFVLLILHFLTTRFWPDMQSHMAVELFKNMKLRDLPPDASTYNIMIDCCSIIRCFKSACAFVSMMLRDGFCPQTCTYTALIKILLTNEEFDDALCLLYQLSLEGIQEDVLLFNTILLEAHLKGRIDVIELVVERMHREKIQPDPSTCSYVFSAYVDRGFFTTAMEALQVLSLRMISEEERPLQSKREDFEQDFVLAEDSEAEARIIKIFMNSNENLAAALLNLRWCALAGFTISWSPEESLWARRLSSTSSPVKRDR